MSTESKVVRQFFSAPRLGVERPRGVPVRKTFLAPEEHAYPDGGQHRRGKAYYPDGVVRQVWGGVMDTFSTVPAHGKLYGKYVGGCLTMRADGELQFTFSKKYDRKAEQA